MAHTIVTNTCEGVADCVEACPVACIHAGPGKMPRAPIGSGLILPPVLTVAFVCKCVLWRGQLCLKNALICN